MEADEEELRHGTDRLPPRLRRPATVVLVALAGLGAAWVTTRLDPGGGTSTGPTPTPVTTSTSTSSTSFGKAVSVIPVPGPSAAPVCPRAARCRTTTRVPAGLVRALGDNYPGAVVVSVRTLSATVGARTTLVHRSIRAVAGPRRFSITVDPFVLGSDDLDRSDSGATSTVRLDSASGTQRVHVLLTEPRAARPNDLTVVRLARDPRLAALR